MTAALPLIVTRADPGGAATAARARAMGLDAYHLPLFAARPLAWTPPDPGDFDALLLTSAQAPRLAGSALARLAALPAYAVGPATAAAAVDSGLRVAMTGATGGRDLIDAMTSRKIERILWLCARERSPLDAPGAMLVPLACYAVDAVEPSEQWHRLIAAPAVLLAHSVRGAARLAEAAAGQRAHLALAAISAAVAEAAGPGWDEVAIATHPDDAALLAEAHALCHKGRKMGSFER